MPQSSQLIDQALLADLTAVEATLTEMQRMDFRNILRTVEVKELEGTVGHYDELVIRIRIDSRVVYHPFSRIVLRHEIQHWLDRKDRFILSETLSQESRAFRSELNLLRNHVPASDLRQMGNALAEWKKRLDPSKIQRLSSEEKSDPERLATFLNLMLEGRVRIAQKPDKLWTLIKVLSFYKKDILCEVMLSPLNALNCLIEMMPEH